MCIRDSSNDSSCSASWRLARTASRRASHASSAFGARTIVTAKVVTRMVPSVAIRAYLGAVGDPPTRPADGSSGECLDRDPVSRFRFAPVPDRPSCDCGGLTGQEHPQHSPSILTGQEPVSYTHLTLPTKRK